jgi:hypothetical protein
MTAADFEPSISLLLQSRQDITRRLETMPLVIADKIVPEFKKGLPVFEALQFPPALVEALSEHVHERDYLISKGQNVFGAILQARPTAGGGWTPLDWKGGVEKLPADRLQKYVGACIKSAGFQHHRAPEEQRRTGLLSEFSALDLYTFLFVGRGVHSNAPAVIKAESDFGKSVAEEFKGKDPEILDVVSYVSAKTGFGHKEVVDLLVPSGLCARLDIFLTEKQARIAGFVRDSISRAGFDAKMTPHSLLTGMQAIDPNLKYVGQSMNAARAPFGAYWAEFIAEHRTPRGQRIDPIDPDKIVVRGEESFAAGLHDMLSEESLGSMNPTASSITGAYRADGPSVPGVPHGKGFKGRTFQK